jgi:hypothetical protein
VNGGEGSTRKVTQLPGNIFDHGGMGWKEENECRQKNGAAPDSNKRDRTIPNATKYTTTQTKAGYEAQKSNGAAGAKGTILPRKRTYLELVDDDGDSSGLFAE